MEFEIKQKKRKKESTAIITQAEAVKKYGKHRSWFYYHRAAFTEIQIPETYDKRFKLLYVHEIEKLLANTAIP